MKESFAIPASIRKKIQNQQWVQSELHNGQIPQHILNFSDASMDTFCATAQELFTNKQYQDAADAFLFLATLNPHHYDYWIGLGASTQHCGDYETAIDAYEMAAISDLENPFPYFYLAQCLFAMHDRSSALEAINMALEYTEDREEYFDLYQQAQDAKALILKAESGL